MKLRNVKEKIPDHLNNARRLLLDPLRTIKILHDFTIVTSPERKRKMEAVFLLLALATFIRTEYFNYQLDERVEKIELEEVRQSGPVENTATIGV